MQKIIPTSQFKKLKRLKKGDRVSFTFAGSPGKGTVDKHYKNGTKDYLMVIGDDNYNYPFKLETTTCIKKIN